MNNGTRVLVLLLCMSAALSACDLFSVPTAVPQLPTETAVALFSATPVPTQPQPTVTRSLTPLSSAAPSSTAVPPSVTASQPPTAGAPTLSPTISRTPTQTKIPTITPWWTPLPTRTSTITQTPTPQQAHLRFLRPGAFSKVLSPIQVEAGVTPGEDGLITLELLGEDGRLLGQQRLSYAEYLNRSIVIAPKVSFSIPLVAETARLKLSVKDRLGRFIAISTMDVVLFSIGDNEFFPVVDSAAPYLIRLPFPDQVVTGGLLQVRGLVRPVNNTPVLFELLDEQNQVMSSGKLNIAMPSGALSHTPFEIDLPYTTRQPVKARLIMRQESANRIPGTVALWSVPVLLEP